MNFKGDSPKYRKPKPLDNEWHYVGDGKLHDPTVGDPAMNGRRWTISQMKKQKNSETTKKS